MSSKPNSSWPHPETAKPSPKRNPRFEKLSLDYSPLPTLVLAPDRSVWYVNPAFCQLTGFMAEELAGQKPPFPWWPREKEAEYLELVEEAFTHGLSHRQFRFVTRGGEPIWAEEFSRPVTQDGNLLFHVSHILDLTASDRPMEKSAAPTSAERRLWTDSPFDVVFRLRLKPEIKFEYVSRSAGEVLGYQPEEFYADPNLFLGRAHPEDLPELSGMQQEPQKYPDVQVFRWKRPDGRLIWVERRVTPLFDGDKVWAVDGILRDVSERISAQRALEENEARLREVLTHSQDAAYRRNLRTGLLDYVSPAFAKLTGYPLAEIRKMTLSDINGLTHPEDRERTREYLSYFLKHSDRQGRMEYRLACHGGEYRWLEELFYTVKDHNQDIMYLVGSLRDITERKDAEQAALQSRLQSESQARRLEEANTALKVLLDQREEEKQRQAETVLGNMRRLVLPNLEKIRDTLTDPEQIALLEVAEYYLNQITSQFSARLSSDSYGLTPREVEVANLARLGKTTSEIASLLHVSENAVVFHRQNIRKKLGIHGKKVNLVSFLRQLPQ